MTLNATTELIKDKLPTYLSKGSCQKFSLKRKIGTDNDKIETHNLEEDSFLIWRLRDL